MANTSVFTGADGSITLSTPEGLEGEKAQEVLTAYDMISVGRVQDVKVQVTSEVKPFHEIGQRYATELRPGNVSIAGTIGRAYVNGAMLKLLLGEAAGSRPAASWAQPAFNITLLLENAATPGTRNSVTLHGVKIDNWEYHMPEDDFVMESVDFQALYMTVADEP
jgi:adenosylcobinamide amidohydrolase